MKKNVLTILLFLVLFLSSCSSVDNKETSPNDQKSTSLTSQTTDPINSNQGGGQSGGQGGGQGANTSNTPFIPPQTSTSDGHTHNLVAEHLNEQSATCTQGGYYFLVLKCSICQQIFAQQDVNTPALGHNFVEYNRDDATYEHATKIYERCSRCEQENIRYSGSPLNHNYSHEYSYDDNYHWHQCVDAGYEELYEHKVEHSWAYENEVYHIVSETEDGYTETPCHECGYVRITGYEPAYNKRTYHWCGEYPNDWRHYYTWLDENNELKTSEIQYCHWTETGRQNPDYDVDGYYTDVCNECHHEYTQILPGYEHHYETIWQYDENQHWHNCTDYGYTELKGDLSPHTFEQNKHYVVNPNYQRDGYTIHYCDTCDYYYTDTYVPGWTEHRYEDFYTYDENEHWRRCTDLDEYGQASYLGIDRGEHTYASWHGDDSNVVIVAPDYTNHIDGTRSEKCELCDYTMVTTISSEPYYFGLDTNNNICLSSYVADFENVVIPEVTTQGFQHGANYYPTGSLVSGLFPNWYQGTNMKSLTIPDCIETIPFETFENSTELEEIVVSSNHPNYTTIDGVLYNKEVTELLYWPAAKEGPFTVPNTVTSFGEKAFLNNTALREIVVPEQIIDLKGFKNANNTGIEKIIFNHFPDETLIKDCLSLRQIEFRCSGVYDRSDEAYQVQFTTGGRTYYRNHLRLENLPNVDTLVLDNDLFIKRLNYVIGDLKGLQDIKFVEDEQPSSYYTRIDGSIYNQNIADGYLLWLDPDVAANNELKTSYFQSLGLSDVIFSAYSVRNIDTLEIDSNITLHPYAINVKTIKYRDLVTFWGTPFVGTQDKYDPSHVQYWDNCYPTGYMSFDTFELLGNAPKTGYKTDTNYSPTENRLYIGFSKTLVITYSNFDLRNVEIRTGATLVLTKDVTSLTIGQAYTDRCQITELTYQGTTQEWHDNGVTVPNIFTVAHCSDGDIQL